MAASPVIHSNQLRNAREAVALSLAEAATLLEVSSERLASWESGTSEPTLEELEALGRLYARDLSYFLADYPRPPGTVYLRTASHRLLPELNLETRKVLAQFEELCRFEWELEKLQEIEHVIRFTRQRTTSTPEELARIERLRMRLDSKPIPTLRDSLEREGIRVFWLPLPEDSFAGLSWWNETYGPCVLVNLKDTPGRRNFTMAHEFAHLLTEPNGAATACDLSDIESERFANRFAAVFLIPESDLTWYWHERAETNEEIDQRLLINTSRRYGVSVEALAIRLEELGLLPNATSLIKRLSPSRSYGHGKPDWRRVRGEAYVGMALSAYRTKRLSAGKLADYLGLDLRTALRMATGSGEPEQ